MYSFVFCLRFLLISIFCWFQQRIVKFIYLFGIYLGNYFLPTLPSRYGTQNMVSQTWWGSYKVCKWLYWNHEFLSGFLFVNLHIRSIVTKLTTTLINYHTTLSRVFSGFSSKLAWPNIKCLFCVDCVGVHTTCSPMPLFGLGIRLLIKCGGVLGFATPFESFHNFLETVGEAKYGGCPVDLGGGW